MLQSFKIVGVRQGEAFVGFEITASWNKLSKPVTETTPQSALKINREGMNEPQSCRPVNGEQDASFCLSSTGALTFLLAMGRNDGVGQISGFYVGQFMVRLAKSRDLFISTSWKTMRQCPP